MREEHFPPPSPAVCAVTSQFCRPPRILLLTGSDLQMFESNLSKSYIVDHMEIRVVLMKTNKPVTFWVASCR